MQPIDLHRMLIYESVFCTCLYLWLKIYKIFRHSVIYTFLIAVFIFVYLPSLIYLYITRVCIFESFL